MKTLLALASASVLFVGSAFADEAAAKKPIVVKDERTVQAKVIAIDHTTRDITLEGEKGVIIPLTVDESVKRFDALKVGDTITAHYVDMVSYDIKKPGTQAAPDVVAQRSGKFTGDKPGGATADVSVTTVTITKIDTANAAVTVRGSDGQVQTVKVRHPEHLKEVKVGDVVVVTKTSALMINVD